MIKRRLKVVIALAVLGALAAGMVVFVLNRPVAVVVAGIGTQVPVRVFGLGTIEARVLSKIGFELGGTLTGVDVDHGDIVARDAPLAHLDASAQEARLARAEAAVQIAEADVARADAGLNRARAVLKQAKLADRRVQGLALRGTVSEQTAEEAARDLAVATADAGVAGAEIEVARARLVDARAALAFERIQLRRHGLTAPFDAMVVERHREPGAVVAPGEPIFTLIDPTSVWVLAYVDEARAGPIELDQPAEVRLRSLPQTVFPARVARIGIESDRVSEERRVFVKCLQCPIQFHLGEQAEVLIDIATLERALMVPEAAVAGFDGARGRVWTVEDGRLHLREATFGHRTAEGTVEIRSGVPEGAQVVAQIVAGLREGRRAIVVGSNGG